MAFTQAELDNIAVATLDLYLKGPAMSQTIQDKPLLKAMKSAQKTFGGAKENISGSVKGNYDTYFAGYTHNDQVTFKNPTNLKRWAFSWAELSGGLEISMTELKKNGIHVVDTNGQSVSRASDAEKYQLNNLMEDKLEDMSEGMARDMNEYFWGDGTADAKGPMGVTGLIVDDPSTGSLGGIDRAANAWWRNRSHIATTTASDKLNVATNNDNKIANFLQSEIRQLRRYGGRPTLGLAGSTFLDYLEAELRKAGYYTQNGWQNQGGIDIGMANPRLKGVTIDYDPTLDDLSLDKRLYLMDPRHIFPYVMQGEDMKTHNPARPHDRYMIYKAVTWTGNVVVNQLNCHGVYEIATTTV
ncbi:hypothetical protein DFO67_1329 [Modicisalibacter xianhensis]|uniref:Phage major capsid protein, HK97 family n=1 Tax=Modicisalibacter xianhensis TaxID=442341 RepID=A0A4R8F8H2_9GAMM|nr:phage major capsid protein [Halomonas xianhensis]TDX21890.1 hypothetical protein DFO67_1329 [Halomonas xianhensis]